MRQARPRSISATSGWRSGSRASRRRWMARPLGAAARARGGQRRREELIAVACRVFAAKGFDGASLQDIADEFGVLKGSLFHYIQSKDELLYEIIRGVYAGAEEDVWPLARGDDAAVARLRRVIAAYV